MKVIAPTLNNKKAHMIQVNVIDLDVREPVVPDTSSIEN
jgi:hypothetical protein